MNLDQARVPNSSAQPTDGVALLRSIARSSAYAVRRRNPLIHQMRHHSLRRMTQMVAVVEPDARVAGNERNVVRLTLEDVQRVDPPRASRRGDAVTGEHHSVMTVQVHGMQLAAVVVDVHDHDVALTYHVHRHIGIQMPVDRPPQSWNAADESGATTNRVVEAPVCLRRVEGQRGWISVAQ